MGNVTTLTSSDGHSFEVYEALPDGNPMGTIVVVQEIFGVNAHIREVADGYAREGYRAMAPALFDRVEPKIELGYAGADMMQGIEIARGKLDAGDALLDIQTTVLSASESGAVGLVGYCFGGLMAFLSACQVSGLACAVSYYGGGIAAQLEQSPSIPLQFHFAELDAHIPMSDVDLIRNAYPQCGLFTYDADHGFNCDHRASFDEAAADLARQRALDFFAEHMG
jgi:carboxymethylenebutenolidase